MKEGVGSLDLNLCVEEVVLFVVDRGILDLVWYYKLNICDILSYALLS